MEPEQRRAKLQRIVSDDATTPKELLALWGAKRRDRQVVERIDNELRMLGLRVEPPLVQVPFDSEVRLVPFVDPAAAVPPSPKPSSPKPPATRPEPNTLGLVRYRRAVRLRWQERANAIREATSIFDCNMYPPGPYPMAGRWIGNRDRHEVYAGVDPLGNRWVALTYIGKRDGRDALLRVVRSDAGLRHELIDYLDLQGFQ